MHSGVRRKISAAVGSPPFLPRPPSRTHDLPSFLDALNSWPTLTVTLETRNRVRENHDSVGVTSDHPCVLSHFEVRAWDHETHQDGGIHVVLDTLSQL